LRELPNLRAIVTATVGFDHIDLAACAERGVAVAHSPLAHADSAAELTWALLLTCARKIKQADAMARKSEWSRDSLMGFQLAGKTHGIIGLGRIGTRVARMARGFGMNVVAHDPYRDNEWFKTHEAERVGLDELFHMATTVSIHTPLTRETNGRIHRIHFDHLKADSILINTARGGIIKEDDLILHLKNKGPGHFGLDVFSQEPLRKGYDLLNFPQVVMTPHIGATTLEALEAVSFESARNLVGLLTNGAVSGPLPPHEEWYQAVSGLAVSVGV
jgi:D-3-phosphoglycerate dehydrogenase